MNGNDIFKGMKYIDRDLIQEAEFGTFPEKKVLSFRRPILVAAIVTLMVMLLGCAVVALNLKEITLGQREIVTDIQEGQETKPSEIATEQVVTLAGLRGTPAFMAAQEWYDFQQTYELNMENPEYPVIPEEYYGFGIYTQEMKDKLDEILKKYDLRLPGKPLPFQTDKLALKALDMGDILVPGSASEMTLTGTTYYENNNLDLTFRITLPDGRDTWGNLYYRQKNAFIGDTFSLTGDWQEKNYTTASGHDILILRSADNRTGILFCDLGDSTATVRFDAIDEYSSGGEIQQNVMTDRQIELLADAIDFSRKPQLAKNWQTIPDGAVAGGERVNGYSVSLKSTETDGYTATITLGITAPEGTVLMDPSIKDYQVSPGNWYNCLTGPVYVDYEGTCAEDGDGQDNTMDYVIKASSIFTDGRKAFTAESAWRIYFEDICGNYWDETALEMVYAPIAEGTWVIDISFAD